MAFGNPVFENNKAFNASSGAQAATDVLATPSASELDRLYERSTNTGTERISYDDVIVKTGLMLALVLAGGVVGWMMPALALPGLIIGFVLGLVNSFRKQPSPALISLYSLAEGVFLGALSGVLEAQLPGIAWQAAIATFSTLAVTLALFATGKVRASAKATKVFMIALGGYMLYSLVNLGLMLFGVTSGAWGLNSTPIFGLPLGLIIGVLAVLMAAYSLVLDFDFVQRAVKTRQPQQLAWTAAFGIIVTLVWLYVEFIRIFAIARSN